MYFILPYQLLHDRLHAFHSHIISLSNAPLISLWRIPRRRESRRHASRLADARISISKVLEFIGYLARQISTRAFAAVIANGALSSEGYAF
jgi:hypothetical protein